MKHPVPDKQNRLTCFGGHSPELPLCIRCDNEIGCIGETAFWNSVPSIQQTLYRLERRTYTPIDSRESFAEAYARIYERHYGRSPNLRNLEKPRARKLLERARIFCAQSGISREIYITAQMHGMAKSGGMKRYGFQPNMLVGENAKLRYNVYTGVSRRRYKRTTEGALDSRTQARVFTDQLSVEESAMGTHYTATYISSSPESWLTVSEFVDPDEHWCAVDPALRKHLRLKRAYDDICRRFSREFVEHAKELATLRAACIVAERYQLGLSARIGFKKEFSWETFASLLQRLFSSWGRRERPDLAGIPGTLWGNG